MEDFAVPLEPVQKSDLCDRRIWIGNLDQRVNEYQLLKLVRVYGNIEKFDMMFHKVGPSAGQPRGFAFVTYKTQQDALKAMNSLNGQMLGSKKISVKFAKNCSDDKNKEKQELSIAALSGSQTLDSKISKKTAIQSIEAKLKMMESKQEDEDFMVNRLAANEPPVIAQYQNKPWHPQKSGYRRRHPYHRRK